MGPFIFTLTTRVWQLAAINLTALGLTLLGGGLLGLAPALAATLWATARMNTLTAGQLARGMWREYRAEFATANLAVWPLALVVLGSLTLALVLPMLALIVLLPLAWIAAGYALAAVYAISRLSGSATDALANARIGFSQAPMSHLIPVLALPFVAWVASHQPLVALYFGLSAPCLFINTLLAGALASAMPSQREILQ
ncbi:DUF624 domain-containing protein [Marinovum sp.]|uniref:DUF624 domain-containing protein n=1 Tax=Marinovum sp. TaxID=2024839 RepID=UPI003A94FC28